MLDRRSFAFWDDKEQEAQSLVSAIALRKATQKYGIKHAISFHRSIKSADDFAKLNTTLNSGNVDNILLSSSHISNKKSAGERARLLNDFAHEHLALMTNARCLTEGVDVPAIDCVLFAEPKQSIVDIVQASGRALRPYAGKVCGYIMLPLIGMKLDLNSFAEKINAKIWERVAKVNWRPFEEARSFVHELNLKSNTEWVKYCQSRDKPDDIPANLFTQRLVKLGRLVGFMKTKYIQ